MDARGYLYCALAVVLAVYIYGLRPIALWRKRKFPGPKNSWLIGNAQAALGIEQHDIYKAWTDEYGPDPVAVLFASDTLIIVGDADDARKVLLHNTTRPVKFSQDELLPRTEDNDPSKMLLWSSGELWKSLRAAWQPVFFSGSLKGYLGIMDKAAMYIVEEIKDHIKQGKDQYCEVEAMVQALTLSVIAQTAFGLDLHAQKGDKTEVTPEEREQTNYVLGASRLFLDVIGKSPLVILAKVFPFMAPAFAKLAALIKDKELVKFKKGRYALLDWVNKLLQDHKASIMEAERQSVIAHDDDENKAFHANAAKNGLDNRVKQPVANGNAKPSYLNKEGIPALRKGVKPGSFLDLLVRGSDRKTGTDFTDQTKAQQVLLMLLAGYETTANTLTFAMYLLSRPRNADRQAKLIEEIDSLGKGYTPDYDDLETKTPYMDAVLKETLRLYPTAHLLIREAQEDQVVGGYKVYKGQLLTVSTFQLHHDKRAWGDTVEDFMPERWLSKDTAEVKNCEKSFFAFGDGPRGCPGRRFAMLEAKITLLRIFQHFSFELGPHQDPLPLRSNITLGPKCGLYLKPHSRMQAVSAS